MADQIDFKESFNDSEIIAGLERITNVLKQIQTTADQTGQRIDKAFHPDFALGVTDALNEVKKKYAELKQSSEVLRTALRNATDPDAIKLYKSALQQAEGGMKQLEKSAKAAGVSLKDMNREAGTGKQVFNEFFGQFTKVSLIVGAVKAVADLTKYAVELSQQTSIATKQFTAFLGSADLAAGVVADLTAFSARKFLDTGDVLSAGKALAAFGEDTRNLVPVLSRVADIAAATGKDFNELATIYGKARTAGVLYAEDINQLVDAGIPIIQEFAKQLGVSTNQVKKLASEGKISFEELQLAFFNLTKEGSKFAGQAETSAFTIGGAWRGLVGELRPLLESVGDFFAAVGQRVVNTATDLVRDVKKLFGINKEEVGAFFDIPVQKEKAALDEQHRLEVEAEKRRKELAAKSADDRRKELERRRKEFQSQLDELRQQARKLEEDNTLNPVERVLKQQEDAIDEAKKLQAKLLKLATGADQKAEVNRLIEKLFAEINAKYAEELSKAADELEKLRGGDFAKSFAPLPQLDQIKNDLLFRSKSAIDFAKETVKENSKTALQEIQDFIQNNIGAAGKELLVSAFSDITAGLNALNEAQINQQDRIISALDARIQKQQEVVDKEKELAEQGLANNVSIEQDKLDKLQQQREEAEKKRLALEKKAATQQLVIDTAQQISSLTTAAANVFKAESGKGLLGILFALSAIGVLFATFAKAKALASKSATPPKFRKGGKVDGRTHEEGGEAVTDYDGHVFGEVEKGEWIIGTQPSREHDKFLQKLNEGKYRGVPLANIVDRSVFNTPLSGAEPRISRIEQQHREAKDAQQYRAIVEAQERVGERIVRAITEKETVMPWKNGYREKVRKGSTVITKTVLPE